ncbi:MAG TPA: VanZ family protein [Longimicrobiales bacterium]|nr:VanZ family protein [Longimicrobiales bacterium]
MRVALGYLPLVLWAAGVLILGGLDMGDVRLPAGSDKLAHFVIYAFGGALAAGVGRLSRRGSGWPGMLFVALVAAADELRQAGLPHRTGDPWDWAADMAGALIAFLLLRRRHRKSAGGT